jgi:predicted MPP superfamily phosphohydrolase
MTGTADAIVLVHLSDIHFTKLSNGGETVLNDDVRKELRNDVVQMAADFGNVHGILVTGDIAFSGKEEEYRQAEAWLMELCQTAGCKEEDVWVICGNHDVHRPTIDNSKMVRMFQEELRKCDVREINEKIGESIRDHAGKTEIFAPLCNYNSFARKFGGHFAADQLVWQEDLRLNDGSKLRIRGMNSAICSNKHDDLDTARLVVGAAQCAVERADGVEYLVMCHHPPDWLRDSDNVLEYLDSRVRLQLFGHKHKLRVQKVITGDFESLRLHAGAVNPERDEQTVPRYNFLRICVETDAEKKSRVLRVDLFPRIWNATKTKFVQDAAECDPGEPCHVYRLTLSWLEINPLVAEASVTPIAEVMTHTQISDPLNIAKTSLTSPQIMSGSRRLVFRFLSLPFHLRMEVAHELKLLEASDSHIDDTELFKRLFRRAAERDQLAAFYSAVETKHTNKPPAENPFA